MKQNASSRRLNEQARSRIASILLTEIADPRVAMVTVTGAEVSTDRSVCNVFISTEKGRYNEVAAGLAAAKGRIRSLMGRGLGWRVTPELHFLIDTSVDEAERITKALRHVPSTLSIPKDEEGQPLLPDDVFVEDTQQEVD
jgi:ribosome-binding factor A